MPGETYVAAFKYLVKFDLWKVSARWEPYLAKRL